MDMHWLAQEAKHIHSLFAGLFYTVILVLILLGVVLNYFKMPMGQVPEFLTLIGRAVVAAFLLVAFPEIMNTLADITDQLSKDVGQLNNFKLVVTRLGEKVGTLTWSWVSYKDSILLLVSYVSFFLLYVTVYLADAIFLFTWMLLYIFSPILIAGFVLPSTSAATKGLFAALIEVCLWKLTWSVLAALLWSFALSEINTPRYNVDFLTAILLNIMLAFSVVVTPLIVRALLKGGGHQASASLGGAILGVAALTPTGLAGTAKKTVTRTVVGFKNKVRRGKDDDSDTDNEKSDR